MTATLEKSTDKLATLSAVLMRPSGRQPDVMCPEFVVIPPQIVLINSTGQELIPRLPIGACGSVEPEVLSTLAAMSWQPLSVRLVTKVSPVAAPKTFPGASIGPGSIKASPAADPPRFCGPAPPPASRTARRCTDPRSTPLAVAIGLANRIGRSLC